MLIHTAEVRGRKIAWDKREVVRHGLNADRIKFDLDAEFRACDSCQVVLCGPSLESPKRYIPDKDMTVAVPPSLMESTGPVSTCLLGYVGGEVRIVTAQERYPLVVVESGFTGTLDPGEEQPDLWAQIMSAEAARIEAELAREAAETARADAEAKRVEAEKGRETASAEAVKAANDAAAKAEEAARLAESRVTAALAEVAKAEQSRDEAEKARDASEKARGASETARADSERKREVAEAKRQADTARAVSDAESAASEARAAASKAEAGETSREAEEAKRAASETARKEAEDARKASEQDRETAETGRVEAEMGRVTADAERGQRVDASVQKADAATAKATEAAGKAIASATEADAAAKRADEAARGASENVLVGTKTAGVVHVEDAYPAQLRECKVLGKSVQDGTPTHDAPKPIESVRKAEVVVAGRNLLPRFTVVSSESKGFRYRLLEDGGVEYAGVGNTGTSYFYPYGTTLDSTDSIFTLPKGTYTVSSVKGVPMLFGMRGRVGDGPVKTITGASINNPGSPTSTFTLDGDTQITHVQFTVNVGAGSGVQYVNLEYGRSASGYEPHVPPVSTAIDLKGRELRSLPNGVRDELAVGSDGSAKLTVRTGRGAWRCSSVDRGADKNYAKCRFPDLGANYSPVISERAVNNTGGEFGTCYVNAKMVYVVVPQEVTTPEQADALYGGMQVVYQLAEPQAVELGMVEVPSIKTPTANLWNADPVATEVSATYVRDVTLAISNIEDKINSAVAAIPLLAAAAL